MPRAGHWRGIGALFVAVLPLAHANVAGAEEYGPPAPPAETSSTAPAPSAPSAAHDIADVFSRVGRDLYEDCVFELSEEQLEVQAALIQAYIDKGADGATARRLAANQIKPPKLSKKCENLRHSPTENPASWTITLAVPEIMLPKESAPGPATPDVKPPSEQKTPATEAPAGEKPAVPAAKPAAKPVPAPPAAKPAPTKSEPKDTALPWAAKPGDKPQPAPSVALADLKMLPQWDCADNVDFVTIKLNGYDRKLTGGEICNPYEDVVREVPAELASFKLGYTIKTGRLFVIASGAAHDGRTIAWAISGRDVCRNNPDPNCFAARAVGPLPPGEYSFGGDKAHRITFGPKTKRNVAAVYLKKLWNRDRFNKQQTKAILARGNIAIHARHKGEMSEACLGLEPKGWAYVAGLIKDGRATALDVYIDEPHAALAEAPPLVEGSGFSLTSLFK